jgi:hypothetical protein
MTASDDTPAAPSAPDSSALPRAPRGVEDQPWAHPADGGDPLDGSAMLSNTTAFGLFQASEEFPDDLAQALRRLFERMHRSGFRDWECEWDYVEASCWSLRRCLEINAREAFRLWYGDELWREPFRTASRLQEEGEIEYRIDHVLATALGVEVRALPKEALPAPQPGPRRRARHGELARDVLGLAGKLLGAGEFVDADEVARRLQPHVEYHVHPASVFYTLSKRGDQFDRQLLRTQAGQQKAHFALRPVAAEPSGGAA